jgi:hypothetical protein
MDAAIAPPHNACQAISSKSALERRMTMELSVSKRITKYARQSQQGLYAHVALIAISLWMLIVGFLVYRSGVAVSAWPQFVWIHCLIGFGLALYVIVGRFWQVAK